MKNNHDFYFAEEVAKVITSKFNQHETLIIIGKKGSGKSWAAGSLAIQVSEEVAKIKGGKPEDYFNLNKIAIISKDEVVRVMQNELQQYNTIILDDIGVGWGARDFMTKFNKVMNNVYQTFRTRNVFLIMTVPDPSLLDAVPRFMLHYQLELTEAHFELGYVEGKLKESVRLANMKKNIYPFIRRGNTTYPKTFIFSPPKSFSDAYEPRRKDIEQIESDKGLQSLIEMDKESTPSNPNEVMAPMWGELLTKGFSMREIGKMSGVDHTTVSKYLKKFNYV